VVALLKIYLTVALSRALFLLFCLSAEIPVLTLRVEATYTEVGCDFISIVGDWIG